MGIFNMTSLRLPWISAVFLRLTSQIKILFGYFLSQKNPFSLLMLGMVNGLLPCGLTYLALTYCLTLQGPLDGFNFMILMGAGTMPAMLGFAGIVHVAVKRFQINVSKLTMVMMIFLGVLLIGRATFIGGHSGHPIPAAQNVSGTPVCK
jgi:hypothetical protein